MYKSTTPLSIITFVLLVCTLLYSCDRHPVQSTDLDVAIAQKDLTYLASSDSLQFEKVKQYIAENGKHDRVSVSALAGDTSMMVDYYRIERDGWGITIDHHTRIYFSYDSCSYGNIHLAHDSVRVEPYYIGPKQDIDTLREIISPITALYNELVNEAMQKD